MPGVRRLSVASFSGLSTRLRHRGAKQEAYQTLSKPCGVLICQWIWQHKELALCCGFKIAWNTRPNHRISFPPICTKKNTNTAKQRQSIIPREKTCFQLPVGVRRIALLISALRRCHKADRVIHFRLWLLCFVLADFFPRLRVCTESYAGCDRLTKRKTSFILATWIILHLIEKTRGEPTWGVCSSQHLWLCLHLSYRRMWQTAFICCDGCSA